jgi:hypothetical protein
VTDPPGFADAARRFDDRLDAAVVRARRAASAARETGAAFRRETRQLADRVRTGAAPADRTVDDGLRRAAAGFRADHGLPVEELPTPEAPTTPGPLRTPGRGRQQPRPGDDDEDFSQERIMQ